MPFVDLREFITKCEQLGEVQRVDREVDWNLEAGAITRRCCELGAPAPFFQKIKNYPRGYRLFGAPLATYKRLAIALDLEPDAPFEEIMKVYEERKQQRIKPRRVNDGPCKENVLLGDQVDLFRFPAPLVHEGDGGRYISTWHIIATKDPDSEWVNWGMYRQMIASKDRLVGYISPYQHIGILLRQKYEPRNKPMEFAVAIAPEPITTFVGASPIPAGISEVDIIGGIRREPLNIIKCEMVDLEVPATSEIVIEGEVLPKERDLEGPFGEYIGYRMSPRLPRPVYRVKAITHRNDPILTVSNMGIPTDESHIIASITFSSEVYSALRAAGFPVTGVYVPPELAGSTVVVATKTPYNSIAPRIAGCVWATSAGANPWKVIVVDDDIDPTNVNEVMHAWATKCHPVRGTTIIPSTIAAPIPCFSSEEQFNDQGVKVCYDCTWPHRWPKDKIPARSSFNDIYPEEIKRKVIENWGSYGFNK